MAILGGIFRVQEGADEFERDRLADYPAAHHQHVHVVVLDALVRRIMIVAQPGAHSRDFVGCHRSAHAAATNKDSALRFGIAHCQAHGFSIVRVVHWLRVRRPKVQHLVLQFPQQRFHALL